MNLNVHPLFLRMFSSKLVISFSVFGPNQNTAATTQGLPETMKFMAFEGQLQVWALKLVLLSAGW